MVIKKIYSQEVLVYHCGLFFFFLLHFRVYVCGQRKMFMWAEEEE